MKDTCLNEQQKTALYNMFGTYLNGMGDSKTACLQKVIYDKVLASGKKYGFCVDTALNDNGSYNPSTGTLKWKDESGIPVASLFGHEFFHGYQDSHYTGGTAQFNTGNRTGYPNLEFEQALFYDIITGSAGANAMGSSADQTVVLQYRAWIATITNNNTSFPKQFIDFGGQYYVYLNLFYQHSTYANVGSVNTNLNPSALLNIFSSSNCK